MDNFDDDMLKSHLITEVNLQYMMKEMNLKRRLRLQLRIAKKTRDLNAKQVNALRNAMAKGTPCTKSYP